MDRRNLLVASFLLAYFAALLLLLPNLSLWLDEILTLVASAGPDAGSVIEHMRTTAGGTPLAFLVPHWSMEMFGSSAFAGRLPSAMASVLACVGVWTLAKNSGIRWPWAALMLFALCPLQFRYAMEARPYALALCLTVWATVLITAPWATWRAVLYGLLSMASGLTLAYALFVPAGHFAWLLLAREERRKQVLVATSAALGAAVLVPWYLYFREDWVRELAAERIAAWNWKAPFVFLREITGAGYIGTILMGFGAALGLRRLGWRSAWLWWLVAPVVLVPIGNVAFHYFFAVRQVIYVIAPLALLFARGIEVRRGAFLLSALLITFLYADVKWVTKPREDWAAAARHATRELQQASCVAFVPLDAEIFFGYTQPGLTQRQCPLGPPADRGPVVLAVSPKEYDLENAYPAVQQALLAQGYVLISSTAFTGPRVERWHAR